MKTATDKSDLQYVGETFDCDPTFAAICYFSEPHFLTQGDLNYLVRRWNLSKNEAKILASRLKDEIFCSRVLKYVFWQPPGLI
jgi:hypothetical protein